MIRLDAFWIILFMLITSFLFDFAITPVIAGRRILWGAVNGTWGAFEGLVDRFGDPDPGLDFWMRGCATASFHEADDFIVRDFHAVRFCEATNLSSCFKRQFDHLVDIPSCQGLIGPPLRDKELFLTFGHGCLPKKPPLRRF